MIQNTIDRHLSFWRGKNTEPLFAQLPHPGWSRKPYPLSRDRFAVEPYRIEPTDIDIDKLLGADRLPDSATIDEFFRGVKTMYPVACMESVVGCPIYAADTSCYARPYDSLDVSESVPSSTEWQPILESILTREVALADGRLPALQLHLRGIVDMVAAYWGEERMCLAMFDDPGSVHDLSSRFAEIYIDMAKRGVEVRPTWHGGYVSHWGIFAPAPVLDYQIDATSILSRIQYDEFFLDIDGKIISTFPYSVIHLHACGLHMAPSVATWANAISPNTAETSGRAIEISLDREAGAFEIGQIIDTTRMIQESNSRVVLHGELYESEIETIIDSLSPAGLAIYSWRPRQD